MLVALYTLTMFISATLLFVVQPMIAKLLLPSLGGSSAVWTTCMLFFQAVLLLGYGYAHVSARWLDPRRQLFVHLPLMLLAAATLPIAIPDLGIDASAEPTSWLLAALALSVGLPFFVLSTSAPLLQHWFAQSDHPDAKDPYHLYAASNLGSMAALLGYPFLIEPWIGVRAQSLTWAAIYAVFVVGVVGCGTRVLDAKKRTEVDRPEDVQPLSWAQRARWVALAAVPSSLMLGFTQYLTTDLASVPLLWVIPLALYLLTFILVFAKRPFHLPDGTRTWLPLFVAFVFASSAMGVTLWVSMALHMLTFMLVALFMHGTLAQERPAPAHLTEYFLLMSVGGAVGGLFNALVAPTFFDRPFEYQLVLFTALAFVEPAAWRLRNEGKTRWVMPLLTALVAFGYFYATACFSFDFLPSLALTGILIFVFVGLPAIRPQWTNLGFAVLLGFGAYKSMITEGLVAYDRSFFAAYKVFEEEPEGAGRYRKFSHGATVHGSQSVDPAKANIPVSYYHPDGPVGQILRAMPHSRVLVVGLGAGAMATYATDGVHMDMYEIDPLVEEIARKYFTYLDICGDNCTVKIGDGRRLIAESGEKWDIIFIDAYNSDAVPTHLLTREALKLYIEHLSPGGLLALHVSNRYLDVESIVGALAEDGGYATRTQLHDPGEEERQRKQIERTKFTIVARTEEDLAPLSGKEEWKATPKANVVWTDDFTNIFSALDW